MNLRRFSFLTTITLCALAFLVSGSDALALGRVIGNLQVDPPALHVRLNGQPAAPGSAVHQGDLVETGNNAAVINLFSGQCVLVFANTRGRIYDSSEATTFITSRGGFRLLHPRGHRHDDDPLHLPGGGLFPGGGYGPGGHGNEPGEEPEPGLESLPYLAGFNGNFSGSSIGGGGAGAQGPTTTRVLPGGQVGLFDSLNRFIRFL